MTSAVQKVAGIVLLVLGLADLVKFGFKILLQSPTLILGIAMTVAGAVLVSTGRRSDRLLP